MPRYPFPHDLDVYTLNDGIFEIVYYAHEGRKYKRFRNLNTQGWHDTEPIPLSDEEFWMIVACVERARPF